ncbi:AAA family ATPase [Streptomyces sp. NPDC059072]|uniref:AAA family ATPase n=1 Tax=unclassified Streptomyces TaxID=2593676 RepID=UPI0036A8CE6D
MLPPDTGVAFTGRTRELAALRRLFTSAAGEPRRCLITGMAGIGKTALAVHAAHAAEEDFPDGRLHADLTEPDGAPKGPGAVLVRFLRALGEERPPAAAHDLDEPVRLDRTRTVGRRILVLPDNAADTAGLTALLPAGPHSAALVTGHVHLAAATGPHTLALGPMNRDDSLELLTNIVGTALTATEPGSVERLRLAAAHRRGDPRTAGPPLGARTAPVLRGLRRDGPRPADAAGGGPGGGPRRRYVPGAGPLPGRAGLPADR